MTSKETTKKIYLSGPMTGMPDYNYPAFHAVAERFRQAGWDVVSPAENFGGYVDLPRESFLRMDVSQIATCDAIAMLPGWRESRGARMEYLIAHELGMEMLDAQTLEPLADAPAAAVVLVLPERHARMMSLITGAGQ